MFFIPGQLISILTFPGVIVHEIAHQYFCKLAKVAVLDVKYFQFANPAGYVIHEVPEETYQHLLIGLGPLLLNTIVGALIAFPAVLPTITFGSVNPVYMVLVWVGFSIAMHSFPSTGDAKSIWASVMRPGIHAAYKIITVPIVGLLYIGAIGSVFWLDAVYGMGVIMFLPTILFS
jgi:hypothetical protein